MQQESGADCPDRQSLAAALAATFEDLCMSRGERQAVRELLSDYASDPEALNYARNRAFALVRSAVADSSSEVRLGALRWLEEVVKAIDVVQNRALSGPASVHFSPGLHCANHILWLLRAARTSVDVCVFTVADDRISEELVRVHRRGVAVRVLTDDHKARDAGSDVPRFAQEGIPVRTDGNPGHMHHKFAIFDGRVLVNGSFNWTRSASLSNQENIVALSEPGLLASFSREFERLWSACRPL